VCAELCKFTDPQDMVTTPILIDLTA